MSAPLVPQIAPEDCSLVRALDQIGDRWTMLVLRQALYGVTRFETMQDQLGVSRKILAERLTRLVEHQILEKLPYRDEGQRTRHEYRLTGKGRDLALALFALMQWGDTYAAHPDGRPLKLVERDSGQEVRVVLLRADGQTVEGLKNLRPEFWPDRAS